MQNEARAGRTPTVLLDRPLLRGDLAYVWQGYWQLSAARGNNGYGPLAITTAEVAAWLDLHGFVSVAERAELLRLFREMDAAHMRHASEKAASDGGPIPRGQR